MIHRRYCPVILMPPSQVKSPLATSTMLSKKIEGLMKSSPMVTDHASTVSSIYENGVVLTTSGTQPNTNCITPSNESSLSVTGAASVTDYNVASTIRDCGMITSSAISNTISNVGDEFQRVGSVLGVNSIGKYSALPSEPMVDHGTGVDPKENNAPMPGAAKKSSSKMRPGTTNTARYDCG
jgi:hypothetical protein